jgi:serine protease AprX
MTRLIPLDRARWTTSLAAAVALALTLVVVLTATPAGLGDLGAGSSSAAAPVASHLAMPAGSSSPLDPRIASLAEHRPNRVIETIVQFKGGVSLDRARWEISRLGGRVIADLHIINALAVKLTAERARWLAANPDVHSVSLNAVVKTEGGPGGLGGHGRHGGAINLSRLQTTYDQTLGVTGLWQNGINGTGVGVAVIDTGIDGNLPDFATAAGNGSRVVETAVTNPNARLATDSYGHGTDVAGIIAGNGDALAPSDPLRGQFVGVAPGANLVSIKVSDEKGSATVLDVIYGLQFAVDHQADYNIRVVNMSLDSQTPQSYSTDPLDAAAEAAWMHGIVVVAAAGNRGDDSDAVQYAPANDPYVITVGAVDENGTADPSDDVIAGWSSRGTTQDGFHKPDVYAPGAHIVSVLAPGSAFAAMCSACQIGGDYIKTSGTSMATPMIAGLVADLLQAHPNWTPDVVKGALTSRFVASNPTLQEVDAAKVNLLPWAFPANRGLTPNHLIDPTTGGIDYSRSSWSRSTWSTATGGLSAGFAQSSWSCSCSASPTGSTEPSGGDDVGSSTSSWSTSTWSMSSWSTHFDPTSGMG